MEKKILNLIEAASEHLERLKADIILCKTREEHVRLTARANEAAAILAELRFFRNGEDGEPDAAQ